MIKKNELRIGNHVSTKDDKIICTSVKGFFGFPTSTGIINHNNDVNDFEYLKPIPLTEEWLLKFGFRNDEEIGYRWYIEWEGCVILAYDLDDKCIRVSDTWEFGKRKYVHQLQNLYFALTGCELQYVA